MARDLEGSRGKISGDVIHHYDPHPNSGLVISVSQRRGLRRGKTCEQLVRFLVKAMCEFDDDISLFSGRLVHGRGSKRRFREILGQRRLVCQHNFGFKRTDDALVRSEARKMGLITGSTFVSSLSMTLQEYSSKILRHDFNAWNTLAALSNGSGSKREVTVGRRAAFRVEIDMRRRNKRDPVRERLSKESLGENSTANLNVRYQQCRAIACIANA